MTRGIRVTSGTVDVKRAKPQELQFTTEFISPKVRLEDEGSITTDGSGDAIFDIEHGLDYSPVYLVYYNPAISILDPGLNPWVNQNSLAAWAIADNYFFNVVTKPKKLTVTLNAAKANQLYRYKYFIFVEPTVEYEPRY